MLLLVALLERSAAASIKQNQPSLTAFDCDQPDEVRVATVPIDCQHNTEDLRLGESVNISVWQEASEDTLGILCKVERTEWLFYCGVWSHQSLIAPGTTMRPQKVSVKQCQQMHNEGVWVDGAGKEHQVMGEGDTFLNYIEKGSLTYHNNKVTCAGTRIKVQGGETYDRAIKLVDVKVSIRTVVVRDKEEGLEVLGEHLYVRREEIKDGGVQKGPMGTLLVNTERSEGQKKCNLEELGHLTVQATAARGGGGFARILFNKEHKLYLLQQNQTRRIPGCGGGKFWPTNLPGVLVRKETDHGAPSWRKESQRKRKEASLVNHFTELADFTTAELKLDLERARLRETCLRYLNALQGATVGFQPGHHAGTFTEVKGEVATSLKCSKVSVRPRAGEANCYTDMPVSYLGMPRYVEPISRMLKKASAQCSCEEAPALLSQDGHLFRMNPTIQSLADADKMMMEGSLVEDTASNEGVYPAAALEAAQRLLNGRWAEEERKRGVEWNISQPVWHPQENEESIGWSIADLFQHTQWLVWVGKAILATGGAYLVVQVGLWTASCLGAWRGARMANPSVDSGLVRKFWEVSKAMLCNCYRDGIQRGHRAVHRGDIDCNREEGRSQPFNLASGSGNS